MEKATWLGNLDTSDWTDRQADRQTDGPLMPVIYTYDGDLPTMHAYLAPPAYRSVLIRKEIYPAL